MFLGLLLACRSPTDDDPEGARPDSAAPLDTATASGGHSDEETGGGPCDDGDDANDVAPGFSGAFGVTGWVNAGAGASTWRWALGTDASSWMLSDGCMNAVHAASVPAVEEGAFTWAGTTHPNGSGNKPEARTLAGTVAGDQLQLEVRDPDGSVRLTLRMCRQDAVEVQACE